MSPTIVDDNTQDFNGRRYTRFGKYFRARRVFLHRDVWTFHHGEIPERHHIHHIDGNGANNTLSNLECLEQRAHLSMHHKGHTRRPVAALAVIGEWRATDIGKRVMREQGLRNKHLLRTVGNFQCEQCSTDFEAEKTGKNRFCSNACRAKWRRNSGADDEDRICVVCSAAFRVSRYSDNVTCSRVCGGVISGAKRLGVPQGKRS